MCFALGAESKRFSEIAHVQLFAHRVKLVAMAYFAMLMAISVQHGPRIQTLSQSRQEKGALDTLECAPMQRDTRP